MVGFISRPAIEGDLAEPPKLNNNTIDPPSNLDPKSNDPSFADSFFDFASIEEWFKDNPPTTTVADEDSVDAGRFDFGGFEMAEEGGEVFVENPERVGACVVLEGEDGSGGKVIAEDLVASSELIVDGSDAEVKVGTEECEKLGELSCAIEKDFGKVSLAAESGVVDNDGEDDGEDSGSEEASSSSSASSSEEESESSDSSSSEESDSDDDDQEKVKEVKMEVAVDAEVEEGEILEADGKQMVSRESDDDEEDDEVENMVTWSDADEEEEGGGAAKPIKSKNELADLPPVPPVDVELQPDHKLSPVGVVLSVMGTKVIVEGVEKHNPLSEGSILWITEHRSPLGLIDEIFGPVKNPYYVVRYNSESEVPAGLQGGSMISFVPEFANHVLNDKNLYKKGYDASGDNDEELSDEAEFSDDEKEAEYQRMKKLSKRGFDDQNNRKKGTNNRDKQRKNNRPTMDRTQLPPPDQSQRHKPPPPPPQGHGNNSSSGAGPGPGPGPNPSFPQGGPGFPPMPIGPWNNGMMQYQQPQGGPGFPGGFPAQAMPWLLQNLFQNPYQMPMPMPFQQQFDPSQRPPSCPPGGQPGFFPGSACPPWGGFVGQNNFNQQLPPPGTVPNGTQMEQNQQNRNFQPPTEQNQQNGNFQAPSVMPGNAEAPQQQQQFNQGASYGRGGGRGRRQFQRGGGRFGGGGRGRGRGRH